MKTWFYLAIVAAVVTQTAASDTPMVTTLEGGIGSNSYYVFAFGASEANDDQIHEEARARARQLCNGVFVVVESRFHPAGNRGGRDFLIVRCGAELPTNLRYAPLEEYVASYDLANDRYTIFVPIDAVTEIAIFGGPAAASTIDTVKRIAPTMPSTNEVRGCECRVTRTPCEARIAAAIGRLAITTDPIHRCSQVTFSVNGERRTTTVPRGSSIFPWIGVSTPRVEVIACLVCQEAKR